jgi:hypothetical protein
MTILTRSLPLELPRKFLARKQAELSLVGENPGFDVRGMTLGEIFDRKLRDAGLAKARFNLEHPEITETRRDGGSTECGRYDFDFSYQRADLKVDGPKVGGSADGRVPEKTFYTNSGIAALAVVLNTLRRMGLDTISTAPGHYPETAELADMLGLRLETDAASPIPSQGTLVLLDSAAPSTRRWSGLLAGAGLTIFDTSCYAGTSRRILRWLNRARQHSPVVLVRIHAKLDTLGVEYGRLGSVTIHPGPQGWTTELDDLTTGIEDAIRLLGAAPTPVSFPPFVGDASYIPLTRQRIAQIMRNSRLAFRILSDHGVDVQRFQHGLYVTVSVPGFTTREDVAALAQTLADKLASHGLPVRHAGSFGFDFVGLEWFCHAQADEAVLRISAGDLPPSVMEQTAKWLSRLLRSAAGLHRTLAVIPPAPPVLSDEERIRLAALPVPHYGI